MKYKLIAAAVPLLMLCGCALADNLPAQDEAELIEDPAETDDSAQGDNDALYDVISGRQEQEDTPEYESPFSMDFDIPEPFEYHGTEPFEYHGTEPEEPEPEETTTTAVTEETVVTSEAETQTTAEQTETETEPVQTEPEPEPVALSEDAIVCELFSDHAELLDLESRPEAGGAPLLLPERYRGKPVTAVSSYAFRSAAYAGRLRLPETVTKIGDYAFLGSGITDLRLISSSTLHAGNYVFKNCASLETVELNGLTADFGDECFAGCGATAVRTGESTLQFGDRCFQNMRKLENVTLSGDTVFGKDCFRSCAKLESVAMQDGEIDTGSNAFYGAAVKTVTAEDCTGRFGDMTFANCKSLKSLEIGEGITEFGYGVCRNCKSLRDVYLPASLTTIGEDCFSGCRNVTITAPEGSYALRYAQQNGIRSRVGTADSQ